MAGVQKGAGAGRRTLRERKVSQRMAVVDESTRQQAAQARLDALENDNEVQNDLFCVDSDDDEFVIEDEDEDEEIAVNGKRGRKRKAPSKRKIRGLTDRRGPKNFSRVLEEAELDRLPPSVPTYLTAAAAPAKLQSPRKFCSVCGTTSSYTCSRCGSRYCSRKCFTVHTETRCLKFIG